MVLGRAGRQCEECGAGEDRQVKRWPEVQERWAYAIRKTLRRLILLCSGCHGANPFRAGQHQGPRQPGT